MGMGGGGGGCDGGGARSVPSRLYGERWRKPAPLARESRRHVDRGGPAKAYSAWWSRLYLEPVPSCDGDGRVRSVFWFSPVSSSAVSLASAAEVYLA